MTTRDNVLAGPARILITPSEPKKPSSVLFTPEEELPPTQGTVISVGCEVDDQWLDREVIFKRFAGQQFTLGGNDYLSLLPEEVIAYLT